MNFVEFLEGISRAAEYLSLGPPSDNIREAYKKFINTEEIKTSSKQKNKELTVILPYEKTDQLITDFSETILNSRMDEDKWKAFFAKNPVTICSVGSMSSSNSVG